MQNYKKLITQNYNRKWNKGQLPKLNHVKQSECCKNLSPGEKENPVAQVSRRAQLRRHLSLWPSHFGCKTRENLAGVKINRCFIPFTTKVHFSEVCKFEVHECLYFGVVIESSQVHCVLVMGESRMSPPYQDLSHQQQWYCKQIACVLFQSCNQVQQQWSQTTINASSRSTSSLQTPDFWCALVKMVEASSFVGTRIRGDHSQKDEDNYG